MSSNAEAGASTHLEPLTFRPNILTFHKVMSQLSFGVTNYSLRRIERLFISLQRKGFIFQYLEATLSKSDPKSLAITFDDGYQHLADVLPPLMDKYHFKPIIFLPTKYLGKANRWDYSHLFRSTTHLDSKSVSTLAALGVEFGSHSHSHVNLCQCNDKTLRYELTHSKAVLEDTLGTHINYISYPFGRYNQRVLEATMEAGYTRGFTMSFPEDSDNALTIGRCAVYGYDTVASVVRKLSGGPLYNLEKWKAKLTNKLSGGTVIYSKLVRR